MWRLEHPLLCCGELSPEGRPHLRVGDPAAATSAPPQPAWQGKKPASLVLEARPEAGFVGGEVKDRSVLLHPLLVSVTFLAQTRNPVLSLIIWLFSAALLSAGVAARHRQNFCQPIAAAGDRDVTYRIEYICVFKVHVYCTHRVRSKCV